MFRVIFQGVALVSVALSALSATGDQPVAGAKVDVPASMEAPLDVCVDPKTRSCFLPDFDSPSIVLQPVDFVWCDASIDLPVCPAANEVQPPAGE